MSNPTPPPAPQYGQPMHYGPPPKRPNWFARHKVWSGVIVGFVVLSAIGAAAGSTDPVDETSSQALEPTEDDQAQADAEAQAEAHAAAEKCRGQVGSLLTELKEIDSRLDIGMVQADFNVAVGDASVAYDNIRVGKLDGDCLDVAVHLENAFNHYINANTDWSDCIEDYYCDLDLDVLPRIQNTWAVAHSQVRKADQALTAIANPQSNV